LRGDYHLSLTQVCINADDFDGLNVTGFSFIAHFNWQGVLRYGDGTATLLDSANLHVINDFGAVDSTVTCEFTVDGPTDDHFTQSGSCIGEIDNGHFPITPGETFTIMGIELEGHVLRNGKKILFTDTKSNIEMFDFQLAPDNARICTAFGKAIRLLRRPVDGDGNEED
jgi:hypothetical protein